MSIEQNLKTLIGECSFQICVLTAQLEEANKKIQELTQSKMGDVINNTGIISQ